MLLSHLTVSRYLGQEVHTSPPITLSHLPTYHHKHGWLTLGGRTARRGKRAEDSPPQAPWAQGWSIWLHSCCTDDNHITCSHLTAREAGKGRPSRQLRPGYNSTSVEKERMAFGGQPTVSATYTKMLTWLWLQSGVTGTFIVFFT